MCWLMIMEIFFQRQQEKCSLLYYYSAMLYTVKKVTDFPVSSRDVTYQTPPGPGIIILGRENREPFFT
jgi:hypothetical protein